MKSIFLILVLFSFNSFAVTCNTTTRNSYGYGQTLTSSALNTDFNQLIAKVNATSGACLTDASVDMTLKPTGILPLANGGTGDANYTLNIVTPKTSAISVLDINWATLNVSGGLYTKTLAANSTFTFSNMTAGEIINVRITNTASNYTVTWPTVKWQTGVAPTQTIGAKSDLYSFIYDGTDIFGSYLQNL